MKKIMIIILFVLLLTVLVLAQPEHYYKIDLNYVNGDIFLSSIKIIVSQEEVVYLDGSNVIKLVSFNNKVIDEINFGFPLFLRYDNYDKEKGIFVEGGNTILNETNYTIYIPYYDNAQEIVIYGQYLSNNLTIDVSQFAKEKAVMEDLVISDIPIKESEEIISLENLDVSEEESKKENIIKSLTDKYNQADFFVQIIMGVGVGVGILILIIFILVLLKGKKRI